MHPKNPFSKDYDFDFLSTHNEALKDFIFVNKHGTHTIRFADPNAVMALNQALLKAGYNIKWSIPEGCLCPPIPGRLDYLLYVDDLIDKTNVNMLDVGTGANLIYPILGTCHFKWKCVGSEIEKDSVEHAKRLVEQNPELSSIEIRRQSDSRMIFEKMVKVDDEFDVVVCNPPFYKSAEDAQKESRRKTKNLGIKKRAKLNFGGQSNELWTPGGEVEFLTKMAKESVEFKDQIQWFTSLVSRKEHLSMIKRAISNAGATDIRVVEMGTGNKINRAIAWRFN